jgi:site-specific DNA-methyltransferase (adenine-specific)
MPTIRLEWMGTSNPDLSGFNYFVEAGNDFDAADYAAAYTINRSDIDPDDVQNVQNACARLMDGEWVAVTHESPRKKNDKETFKKLNCIYNKNGVMLYQEDCNQFLDEIVETNVEGVFDLIFADPPYFLSSDGFGCHSGKQSKVNKGVWDTSRSFEDIDLFNFEWLSKCKSSLKKDGTIWVCGTHHNIFSIGHIIQKLEMKILNVIVWEKKNPPPNLSCRYFTHSFEFIIWASKSNKSKHVFNYKIMKELNNDKQMKSVWPISNATKLEKIFGKHPTQKPLELLKRIILASSNEGDLVFDPFSGSSTTGVAALYLNRKFIGCEINQEYINLSIKRFDDVNSIFN